MTELEQQQAKLISQLAKQNCEFHYLMGRLQGAVSYGNNFGDVTKEVFNVLARYQEMKEVDE